MRKINENAYPVVLSFSRFVRDQQTTKRQFMAQKFEELYDELSKFQFNVETIITGVNEKGQIIRDQLEFDVYHLSAEKNISNLANHLKRLVSDINK